jgi:peptidoglycan hydrolase-like protein with peptidoglycan-binding domain
MRQTLFCLVVLVALLVSVPSAYAATSFTSTGIAPYVSGIAVKVNGEFVSPTIKTQHNVTVVISVESFGKNYTIDTPLNSDSYTFTENGSFQFLFHDEDGTVGTSTVTVDNIDRTPPVITVDTYSVTPTNAPVTVTASANEGTLNQSTYTFTENGFTDFVATDEAGNVATTTVTVTHIDTTAPVISRVGEENVQVLLGSEYVDAGATATDNMDEAVTVASNGAVDTSATGTYTITYTATDSAGNIAASVTRTVEVFRRSSGGGGRVAKVSSSDTQEQVGRVLGASVYNFSIDLTVGAKGDDVLVLQKMLQEQGYFREVPTGYFGPVTKAAVMAYQATNGISQTGYVGPLTRAMLGGTPVHVTSVEAQIALLTAQLEELKRQFAKMQQ